MSVGDGTFKQVVTTLTATASSFSFFGSMDANGDGLTDSFHVYNNAGIMTIEVYLAQESGVFNQVSSKYSGMPTAFTFLGAMDINGDGKDDIIQQWSNNNNYISFVSYISEGDGNFRTVTTGTSTSWSSSYIMAMDSNGDGKCDLLNAISSSSSVELMASSTWDFSYIIPMDVNGDGKSDLLNVESTSSGVWIGVYLSLGDGTFTVKESSFPIIKSSEKFFSMDVNNDGKQDLVQFTHMDDGRTGIQTYVSNGDGTFATYIDTHQSGPTSTSSYSLSGSALYGDVSYGNDGIPVVGIIEEGDMSGGTGYACYVSKGDGSYTYYRNETHSTPSTTGIFLMTDLNGDGYSDAVQLSQYSTTTTTTSANGIVLWSYLAQDVCSFKTGISSTFTLANPAFGTSYNTNYNRVIVLKNC